MAVTGALRCLLPFVLLGAACGPRGGIPADDDSAPGDDDTSGDDDATVDDNDPLRHIDGPIETIVCDSGLVDRWGVDLQASQRVEVVIDTLSASTTFDPGAALYRDGTFSSGSDFDVGDDEVDCTAPPARFSCPRLDYEVAQAARYVVQVVVNGQCAGGLAEYRIRMAIDGVEHWPIIDGDDVAP